ncbi:hypothetical protein [Salinispora vitiensis]|uniref:hypothetical protein n=1 Tax=Salinispora vitiensis TaxID=999544 RepID=UPI00047714FE|nr:hypothetical protein [Salinispora vitiensis]
MNETNGLDWKLILGLGLFATFRPILSIVGVYESGALRSPVGPIVMTILISVVWLTMVVLRRARQPVTTLTLAGFAYGAFAIVLNLALQPILTDAKLIPAPGMIMILLVNALWGAALGLIAWALLRNRSSVAR